MNVGTRVHVRENTRTEITVEDGLGYAKVSFAKLPNTLTIAVAHDGGEQSMVIYRSDARLLLRALKETECLMK